MNRKQSNEGAISRWSLRSSFLVVALYTILEVSKAMFAEAVYEFSPNRQNPILRPQELIFLMELLKLLVSLGIVLRTSRNLSLDKIHKFIPPALLYFINNCLYYWILKDSSTGAMSLLLHLRLPFTALVHHFLIRRQSSLIAWIYLLMVFSGVVIAQLNDNSSLEVKPALYVSIIICLNSAFASVINEKILKTLEMPFWDQQLRMYAFGAIFSLVGISVTTGVSVNLEAINQNSVFAAIGCILTGSLAGIVVGFLVLHLDNVVKVVCNAIITILITIGSFLLFGIFSFNLRNFIGGTLLLLLGSYLYAFQPSCLRPLDIHILGWLNGLKWTQKNVATSAIILILILFILPFIYLAVFDPLLIKDIR